MIEFHYELDFNLQDETKYADWVNRIIISEDRILAHIDFIFCTDAYLLEMNQKYLQHDTFTDIITFDYSEGERIAGDVFISIERVKDNAVNFQIAFEVELLRVMAHGVLHLIGYNDKSDSEIKMMRAKEDQKMKLFHVEQ